MKDSLNYRVIRKETSWGGDPYPHYEIHEVYYNEDGTFQSWTSDWLAPYGETLDELRSDLLRMLEASEKPVLEISNDSRLLKEVETS